MTNIQVQYWNLQEQIKHNRATEDQARKELSENRRHNIVFEGETNRHNLITEGENKRHNLVTENINQASLAEQIKHNRATESISRYQAETQRITAVSTAELNRLKSALTSKQIDNYDLEILSKLGTAGQIEALMTKNVKDAPLWEAVATAWKNDNKAEAAKILRQLGMDKKYSNKAIEGGGHWYE